MKLITDLLNRWFKIRAGEEGRVFSFFLINFLIGLVFVFVNSSIQSVFLKEFGAKNLPYVMMFQALFQIVGMMPYTALADSIRSHRMFLIVFTGTIGTLLFVYISAELDPSISTAIRLGAYACAYAAIMMMINIQDVHLEKYSSAYFDTLQFKRLIPIVSTGQRFGMILGGFGLPFIVTAVGGTSNLNFLCIALTIANMMLVMFVSQVFPTLEGFETPKKRRTSKRNQISNMESFKQGFRFVIKSPLLRVTAGATFAMVLGLEILRYQYNEVFDASFGDSDSLTGFLGQFAAFAELLTILIPLFVVPRLLTLFGVGTVKLIYPVVTVSCFLLILAAPFAPPELFAPFGFVFEWYNVTPEVASIVPALFFAGAWGRFVKVNLRKAIETTVASMIYNAVPQNLRGRSRAFIEMISRIGGITAGVIILIFGIFSVGNENIALANTLPWQGITYFGLGIAIMYCFFSWRQKREYVNSLITLLQDRNVDLTSVNTDEVAKISGAELKRLVQTLDEEDEEMCIFAVEVLGQVGDRKIADTLLNVMEKKSYRIEEKILEVLGNFGFNELSPQLLPYLKSPSEKVRAAAAVAIGKLGGPVETYLLGLLEDPDPVVRSRVISILLQSKIKSVRDHAFQVLQQMYSSTDPTVRALAVNAIGETENAEHIPLLQHFLKDVSAEVRYEAVSALEKLCQNQDPTLTNDFVMMLKDSSRDVRRVAVSALKKIQNPKTIPHLIHALNDSPKIRNNAIDALAAMGEVSVAPLVDVLKDVNVPVRTKEFVIMALNKIGSKENEEFLLLFAQTELRQAYQNVMYISALQRVPEKRAVVLLIKALRDRNEEIKTLVMRILESMGNSQVLRLVERFLKRRDVDSRTRANALEALGNVGEQDLIRLMLPLYDQMSPQELQRTVANRWELKQPSTDEILDLMLHGNDNWLKACAIFAIGELQRREKIAALQAALRDSDPLIREVAEEALAKMEADDKTVLI
ncbi:MAG: hypothetical protein D6675_10520 [Gemmatimonadetes bacterium]|nr:MAG: hypothetical protein D6675_10520 [Gemmatimonadota bacterium]